MKKGLTHVYTGEGKGKTTAAMGLAMRAAGNGLTVCIFQFCKNTPSGELKVLEGLKTVTIQRADCPISKFVWDMSAEERDQWQEAQQALFDDACEAACNGLVDMVILDEALGAVQGGAMDERQLSYLMQHKSASTELIITGRGATKQLMGKADYVTEMKNIHHPYETGVHARRGIEF